MPAEVGSTAPSFSLKDQDGNDVTLQGLPAIKTLLVFIPFPFTGICEGELCEIRDNLGDLSASGVQVVVITCDTRYSNKKWAEEQGFDFPILSDFWPHGQVAQKYGCFNDTLGVAQRATYVIDADRVVRRVITTDSITTPRDFDSYEGALQLI
jgi:peroxiredoxin